jgi:GNAT superfamily N-acetyltransferase
MVRPAVPDDSPLLREIECQAGERFREVGLDHIADEEPLAIDDLTRFATAGRSWVAVNDEPRVIGYVVVDEVDGCAHIEQVSVTPAEQGKGIGRALVAEVRTWAKRSDLPAVTLTTFADVPWNAPLYSHLGFEVMKEGAIGPGLRVVRDAESARGVDRLMDRVCMRLAVT